jgi:hypothetical protein
MILVAIVGFGSVILYSSSIKEMALLGGKIIYGFNILVIGVVVHLALIFPEENKLVKKKLNLLFLYIPTFVFAIICGFLVQVEKGSWGVFEVTGGFVIQFYMAILTIYSITAIYCLITSYIASYGIIKKQTTFMIIGFSSPMVIGMLFGVIKHGFKLNLPPIVSASVFIMAFFFSYAILKYKMLVIEPVTGFSTASYCGVNCGICKKFIDRDCLGCKNDPKNEKCAVYLCTQKKKLEDCSFCAKRVSCKILLDKALTDFMPMPKYYMHNGIYLIKEPKAEHSFRIFMDTTSMGAKGLCITRQHPKAVMKKYGLKMTPILWLSNVQGENNIEPTKIERLSSVIYDFINKSDDTIILLDGLEYLITHNDFHSVLRLVNFISERIAMKRSCLVISINPLAFKEKELALLARDVTVIDADKIKIHGTSEKSVIEQMLER